MFFDFSKQKMAQSKFNDLAGKFGKGGPPGLGIGLKLLGVAGAMLYGATKSVYTGKMKNLEFFCVDFVVGVGHS